jgi:hypothetical protein
MMESNTESTHAVFPGFEHEDLSVYLRHAWTAAEHNENRKAALERLDLLVGDPLSGFASKTEQHGLELKRSHFEPCKENENRVDAAWVYLVRNQRFRSVARKEAEKKRMLRMVAGHPEHFRVHPTVAARLDADGLFVGIALPRAAMPDSELLLERMKSKKQQVQLLELLSTLPEDFVLSDGQETTLPVTVLSAPALKMALDSFARGVGWLMVGRIYGADKVLNHPSEVELSFDKVIPVLEKIYAFLCFRPPKELVTPRKPNRGGPRRGPGGGRRPKQDHGGGKPLNRPPVVADRVKMRAGTFKGKVGTVLDLRGSEMQVKFGLLPVWVPISDALVLPPRKH